AFPLASVTAVEGEIDPPPVTAEKFTDAPATGRPSVAFTLTTSGCESGDGCGLPTMPDCPDPDTRASDAGTGFTVSSTVSAGAGDPVSNCATMRAVPRARPCPAPLMLEGMLATVGSSDVHTNGVFGTTVPVPSDATALNENGDPAFTDSVRGEMRTLLLLAP